VGGLGKKTPKTSNERETLAGGTLRQTASFKPLCVKLSLSVWPVMVRKKKGRKEEKSQEVYILRMRGATASRQISTKLGNCVRLTDVIKLAKFNRYSVSFFGAVRC